jgi:hypothetical protein
VVLPAASPQLLSHQATATSMLLFIQGVEHGLVPGLCNGTSSSPSHSMWCLKSKHESWVHKTSSPTVNLLVILAMNTQAISGHSPKVNFTNTSFRMGRISQCHLQDIQCGQLSLKQSRCDDQSGDCH